MGSETAKLAADAIRELQTRVGSLESGLRRYKTASQMAFDMYKKGSVAAEDLEDMFDSLLEKSEEDLQVFEKAAQFGGISADALMGRVSERPADDGTMDPLTRMLIEDL